MWYGRKRRGPTSKKRQLHAKNITSARTSVFWTVCNNKTCTVRSFYKVPICSHLGDARRSPPKSTGTFKKMRDTLPYTFSLTLAHTEPNSTSQRSLSKCRAHIRKTCEKSALHLHDLVTNLFKTLRMANKDVLASLPCEETQGQRLQRKTLQADPSSWDSVFCRHVTLRLGSPANVQPPTRNPRTRTPANNLWNGDFHQQVANIARFPI